MTSETRTYIELADITGIEFECAHCGTRVLYLLDKHDRLSEKCPSCYEPWFITADNHPENKPDSTEGVKKAIDGLRKLAGSPFIRARVRLSVIGIPKKEENSN